MEIFRNWWSLKIIRHFHVLGGEPLLQKEFQQTIDFWDNHPNPSLTLNFISNLNLPPESFRKRIQNLERLVKEHKIYQVEIKGKLEHYKIEKYLELTDLFISFNHVGIFGNNVIEASSKGIPIIALDNPVLKRDYKKYFYISKKNCYEKTVDFIEKFSANLGLRIKYANLSTKFYDQYIGNWEQRIKKELDMINEKYDN